MKDKLRGIFLGVLIGVMVMGSVVLAANTTTLYNVVTNGVKIVVDGMKLNPRDANGSRVEPIIYNGTTYLPVRAVADALGKAVYWDGPNYTVYLGSMGGTLTYPSAYLTENNIGIAFSNAAQKDLTDNYGNTYSEGLYFYGNGTAEYLVNMKYSRLKGTLYVPQGTTSSYNGSVKVIADGKTIYTSPVMDKTSRPISFDINIRGYNDIKIQFDQGTGLYGFNIYVGGAGFYQ